MILIWIVVFLIIFILWLFVAYNEFTKKNTDKENKIIQNFDLDVWLDDENFEEKVDDFIRYYIKWKYDIEISTKTYKEIYELLKYREDISDENLVNIDAVFSSLIINKYSTSKISHREDIIKSINSLEK